MNELRCYMKNMFFSKRVCKENSPRLVNLIHFKVGKDTSIQFFWIVGNGQNLFLPALLSIEPEHPDDNLMPYSMGWEDDDDEFGFEEEYLEDDDEEDLFEEEEDDDDDDDEEDLYYDDLDEDFDEDEDFDDLDIEEDEF